MKKTPSGSPSHKKQNGKSHKKMKRVAQSSPIDIPNATSRHRDDTIVPGGPPQPSFLKDAPNAEALPFRNLKLGSPSSSHQADDISGAEHTPGASEMISEEMQSEEEMMFEMSEEEMMEEMQPDKDHGKEPWELIHREDAVYITMDMPGATKETVKVRVKSGFLVIKGARVYDPHLHDDNKKKTYSARISLMSVYHQCKMSEIKGEMNNGVLKITIPKVKEEEMTVIDVQVD